MTQETRQRFEYVIKACVVIDPAVIEFLLDCSKRHYDGHCKSIGEPGGFLYGWRNVILWAADRGESTSEVAATFRELDTLAKLCEIHSPTINLKVFYAIKAILDSINAEVVNLREHGRPTWDEQPFSLAGLFEAVPPKTT